MAFDAIKNKYIPRNNDFYRDHYHQVLASTMLIIVVLILMGGFVLYQMYSRPLPTFVAYTPKQNKMELTHFNEPNLLSNTILRWASKAATVGYTFDFVNYRKQIDAVRPFFTNDGWVDYQNSLSSLLESIVQNQLFVNGVVSGPPVISNEGDFPLKGYTWRVQIPFLVTYQSANTSSQQRYYVVITIVRVPTSVNPQGIGIDQFVMV